jgi:predicted glycosyltransferase
MRFLIDIGHPAHVHLFKHFAWEMQKKGHKVFFTCRDKEFEIVLLKHYGFQFKSFGKKYNSKIGKILGLAEFDLKEFMTGLRFKPDILLSHGSMYAAHAAFLLGKPHISLEDTGNREQVRLYLPFTACVLTSNIFKIDYGKKQIRFNGHHELSYLHPKHFQPGNDFKEKLNLKPGEKYAILRFVAWKATHDKGQKGLSMNSKLRIIDELEKQYKVFISSEAPLPQEFEKYRTSFLPHEIHDALFHADLFIGEGTTMAMEAAILGTPSIYINSLQYSNVEDMAKYGLLFNFKNDDLVLEKIKEITSNKEFRKELQTHRQQMLSEKIDVTAFLVWFVENYPESAVIMREDPEYQLRFR